MQLKFDIAELLVNNKSVLFESLKPELENVLSTKNWFDYNGLLLSFEDAFSDFILYKMKWMIVDSFNKPFEQVNEIIDKGLLVDLFGNEVLTSEFWENEIL